MSIDFIFFLLYNINMENKYNIVFLAFCALGAAFWLYTHYINPYWKVSANNRDVTIYNCGFSNGVDCGVNALMFYVKQGKKEIDINEVRSKAQEIRK